MRAMSWIYESALLSMQHMTGLYVPSLPLWPALSSPLEQCSPHCSLAQSSSPRALQEPLDGSAELQSYSRQMELRGGRSLAMQ